MIKEKHIVNGIYGGHQLSRYIDVYEVSANRCHSVPESGYKGTEATLVDEPAWNEKFSSYSITGATLTGNNFILDNDVTAQANYETAKNLTLQTDGHGSIASTKSSGFIGDTAALSNAASDGYGFSGYSITGATLTGSNFRFTGSDITAKAWFSAVPHYTAKAFNSGTPFQGTTAYTGEYYAGTVDQFRPLSRVSYDNNVRQEFPPIHWVNTAVNLEFTGNIFAFPPITSQYVSVNYNDLYNLRNNMTTFNRNGDYVTAGYMKLNASESAFITAVNIWVTGTTTNSTCNFGNLKINFNGQDLPTSAYAAGGGYACHLCTLNNGAVGKYVLPAPIVITGNDQKLTFYITGTVPQINHTISGIAPLTAEWYGYISGLE